MVEGPKKEFEDDFEIIDEKEISEIDSLMKEKLNFDSKEKLRYEHNKKVLSQLHPGDLIEFKRKLYSHWALYIGNSKIIHFHGDDLNENNRVGGFFTISGVQLPSMQKAQVSISSYWDVINGSYAFRNNLFDKILNPSPIEEILRRAYEKVGCQDFNIFSNNCEHFAKYCRYGIASSDQMHKLIHFGNKVTRNLKIFHYNLKKLI